MMMPINATDSIALILFIIGGLFLYYGLTLNHTGFVFLASIEFMLGIIQLIINRKPIVFD